ncbi:MAG: type I methionyl aminopeptidase [Myxococcales bacterium]|nr:type I methionyl aminopeptidase [Myxococcota bacterium]MDW8282169.1 type I methionyl aminopeptidase [Myxococcales bacterium]
MKIFYKTKAEIEKLRVANLIVADILDLLEEHCRPGVSTAELNELAAKALKKAGAESAFLGYSNPPYPAVLCTSVNEVVVHGIPRRDVVLKDGDIIGLDFGAFKDGFCGDSARTVMVGKVPERVRRLVEATRRALDLAIEKCVVGNRLQDIGWAVQSYVEPLGYAVVRKFVGHGIGRAMHEDPQVPNFGEPNKGIKLKPGLVLAIEPMVNAGTADVEVLEDGWTAVTRDRQPSAHFEHSVAITEDRPIVLSRR